MGTNGTVRDPSSRSDDLNALEARRHALGALIRKESLMILGLAGAAGCILALELAAAGINLYLAAAIGTLGVVLVIAGLTITKTAA